MRTSAIERELKEITELYKQAIALNKIKKETKALSFTESIKKYGRTDTGQKPTLYPWHDELFELIGALWVHEVITTGAAQVGKTQPHSWFVCWMILKGYNVVWSYAKEKMLNNNVTLQFKPVIEKWLYLLGLPKRATKSSKNSLYKVGDGNAIFMHVNQAQNQEDRPAAAGSGVVSVTGDAAILEEYSQYLVGQGDPIFRRLENSRIPSQPRRKVGTSGDGRGIELDIKNADFNFYPHFVCPGCKEEIKLDPKGCLLNQITLTMANGETKESYLSEAGKPVKWFHKDPKTPQKSAFFACPNCEREISKSDRLEKSFFKCLKTGVLLSDFLAKEKEYEEKRISAGISLSPLLRSNSVELASAIIQDGIKTTNPPDWQQQSLGHPSEAFITSVTLDMLKRSLAAPEPEGTPDLRLAGIDQGRSCHWMVLADIYFPVGHEKMPKQEKIDKSIRFIKFAEGLVKTAIPAKLSKFNIVFGVIDNEPSISSTAKDCNDTCLVMADQRAKQKAEFKLETVPDGGIEYDCWKIRNEKFLSAVLFGFACLGEDGYPYYRLHSSFEKCLYDTGDDSPFVHWQKPTYNPSDGTWTRSKDHLDDIYYATMFMEAALAIYLDGPVGMWGLL